MSYPLSRKFIIMKMNADDIMKEHVWLIQVEAFNKLTQVTKVHDDVILFEILLDLCNTGADHL